MDKYLFLTAKEHNWSCIGPEDWYLISWRVFSDRTYRINIWFIPEMGFDITNKRKKKRKRSSGRMTQEQFDILQHLLLINNWGNPERKIDACDGSGWEIIHYDPDGGVIGSSGNVNYIYGDDILEQIVACLPEPKAAIFE